MRTIRRRVLAVCLCCVLFVPTLSFAATETYNFSLRSPRPRKVNHAQEALIEPVGIADEAGGLRVTMERAYYDGLSAGIWWTLANTGEEAIFVIGGESYNDDGGETGISSGIDSHILLYPGQALAYDAKSLLADWMEGYGDDTCELSLIYQVYALNMPIHEVESYRDLDEEEERLYDIMVDEVIAGGQVPVAHGYILEGSAGQKGVMTSEETLETLGLITQVAEARVVHTLQDKSEHWAVPTGDDSPSLDMERYTLRVRRAEHTASAMVIELDRVFPDKESAMQYWNIDSNRRTRDGGYWDFRLRNLDGTEYIVQENSQSAEGQSYPRELADGTWATERSFDIVDADELPADTFQIVPIIDREDAPADPLTLRFEKVASPGDAAP